MPSKDKLPLLGQLVKLIPARLIDSLALKHEIQTRSFNPTSHVVAMMYAQLSHSLSLNDVCDALQNHVGALSQIRHCTPPSRNGLSHANRTRNADMAEELFWDTLESLRKDFPDFISSGRNYPGLPRRFKRMIHAVDSSTIPLVANCLEWAKHRRQKAAAKLHMNLDMQSFLPSFAIVRTAKQSDPKAAWEVCAHLKAGEIAVFGKAYVDFKHLRHRFLFFEHLLNFLRYLKFFLQLLLLDKRNLRFPEFTGHFVKSLSNFAQLIRSVNINFILINFSVYNLANPFGQSMKWQHYFADEEKESDIA
jgi:hypothetical protein